MVQNKKQQKNASQPSTLKSQPSTLKSQISTLFHDKLAGLAASAFICHTCDVTSVGEVVDRHFGIPTLQSSIELAHRLARQVVKFHVNVAGLLAADDESSKDIACCQVIVGEQGRCLDAGGIRLLHIDCITARDVGLLDGGVVHHLHRVASIGVSAHRLVFLVHGIGEDIAP